jgi:hypothetical protein
LAAAFLNGYLHALHVQNEILERLDAVYSYGAIILSVLQERLAEWIVHDQVKEAKHAWKPPAADRPLGRLLHRGLQWVNDSDPVVAAGLVGGALVQKSLHHLPESASHIDSWFVMVVGEFLRGAVILVVWVILLQCFRRAREGFRAPRAG